MPVSDSAYAAAAQTVTPVFAPAGFGNWEAVGALAVGFVAKEAVISSWSQTYAVEEPSELDAPGALGDAVREDFAQSSGGHTTAAVWAFAIFLLAYTPAWLPSRRNGARSDASGRCSASGSSCPLHGWPRWPCSRWGGCSHECRTTGACA